MSTVFVDEVTRVRLCGFAWTFDRLAKGRALDFNAKFSNCISDVSCSLLSFSLLLLNSVTNLFKPRQILTHEWELSLWTDSILISTPYLSSCRLLGCDFQYGHNLGVPLESNLLGQMIFHLLVKCTHDKPQTLQIARILRCLSSWSTVRFQLLSGILHQYKI